MHSWEGDTLQFLVCLISLQIFIAQHLISSDTQVQCERLLKYTDIPIYLGRHYSASRLARFVLVSMRVSHSPSVDIFYHFDSWPLSQLVLAWRERYRGNRGQITN